jgi:hypothetical protein
MQLVPLSVLAAELGIPVSDLANHPDVVTDGASGIRVLPGHICRDLIAQHQAQQKAQAEHDEAQAKCQRAQQEQLEAQRAAEDQAREARAQRQREILRDTPELTALELMMALDSSPNATTPAGRRFDEIVAADRAGHIGSGYKFGPSPNRKA